MIARAVGSEVLKVRRTWIWPLVGLGPFGVISLNALHYALSYAHLVRPGADNWVTLIRGVALLLVVSLVVGIAILASILADLGRREGMRRTLRALPVPSGVVYAAQFITLAGLLALCALGCVLGMALLGRAVGLGAVPWPLVWLEGVRPYLASYGLIGLQLALSVLTASRSLAIGAGIVGVIATLGAQETPPWLPWDLPARAGAFAGAQGWTFAAAGLAAGAVALICGMVWDGRQDRP